MTRHSLPPPGPPFARGDEVAFFPAETAPWTDPYWLHWDYAVIEEVDETAQTFGGHFVATPDERFRQDLNNIVRRTPTYDRWRSAVEAAIAEGVDPNSDPGISELSYRVLAEHPIHGGAVWPHPALDARGARPATGSDE